jgi:hypothetical protein
MFNFFKDRYKISKKTHNTQKNHINHEAEGFMG